MTSATQHRRRKPATAALITMVIVACVALGTLFAFLPPRYAPTVASARASALQAVGADTDAHYLDPIEMVCHYWFPQAARIRSRPDITSALRRYWDTTWTEHYREVTSVGQYPRTRSELDPPGGPIEGPRELLRHLRLYARTPPPQGMGLTQAEEHLWLEHVVYVEFARELVTYSGIARAMGPGDHPVQARR